MNGNEWVKYAIDNLSQVEVNVGEHNLRVYNLKKDFIFRGDKIVGVGYSDEQHSKVRFVYDPNNEDQVIFFFQDTKSFQLPIQIDDIIVWKKGETYESTDTKGKNMRNINESADEKMKQQVAKQLSSVMSSIRNKFEDGGRFGSKEQGNVVEITPSKSGSVQLAFEVYPDEYIKRDKTVQYDSVIEAALEFFFGDPKSLKPTKLAKGFSYHIPGINKYKSYKIETVEHNSEKFIIELRFFPNDKGTPFNESVGKVFIGRSKKNVVKESTDTGRNMVTEATKLFDSLFD